MDSATAKTINKRKQKLTNNTSRRSGQIWKLLW